MAKLPSLVALRAFEAVARRKSIRRAAEELAVDHTVVSRHLRALQTSLAIQLVNTTRRGVQLTPIGEQYAARLAIAFADIASATAQLEIGRRTKSFRIWVSPAFAMYRLVPRLPEVHSLFPQLDVELRSTVDIPNFSRMEADTAIIYGESDEVGVQSVPLGHPRVFPVARPSLLAKRKIERPQQLLGQTLIHAESSSQWEDWFRQCGVQITPPLPGPRLWNMYLATEAAKLGQGIAMANETVVKNDIKSGHLVEVCRSNIRFQHYVLIAAQNRWQDPEIKSFRDWVLESKI
ncbi:LysR substrate-binding domain-containing protein [Bradyrhizobium symbiodeficiens]|uniref:LysR substrate-binding domain-containing protein n=1 Tax=Bradyrhizobium symbiodeficiens TaxID=1404367 RepID=A0ABX5W685_9BRAD|nr:LysR substrate-binding domain-containing protein [Bradyrhizobium symbiodeficiens]